MALSNPKDYDFDAYWKSMGQAGQQQAQINRPSTQGLFGQNTVGADGSVKQSFSGQFGALNDSLTNQAANVAANPMDWGQFGQLGTGEDAGRQASQAAYSQSLSRLNPFWEKSGNKLRTNLFQSGMGDSDAGDSTMGEFGRARNDAYAGAMTDAIQKGNAAQQSAFQGNLASRQNNVSNALRGQMQPFEELQGMQGFLQQPEYNRDNSAMVATAAENAATPARAFAASEGEATAEMERRGAFKDNVVNGRVLDPGAGERRRKWFNSLPDERRKQLMIGFGNWEEMA